MPMIQHTVAFKLKHEPGSAGEKEFLAAAAELKNIPGVREFEMLRQISKKNGFDFGISMKFETQESYNAYSGHPDHELFIKEYWLKGVEDFLEIDYIPLDRHSS